MIAPLGAELIQGDLTRSASLERAVRGVDTVLHLAARAPFERYERVRPTIVQGSTALMAAARSAGVKHFLYASSLLVYEGRETPIDARTPARPWVGYGAAKLEAEAALCEAAPPMRLAIVRLPHVYGARSFLFNQLRRGYVLFPGAGDNRYSHMHVEDAARLLIEAAAQGWEGTGPLGDADPSSWKEFFAILDEHYPRFRLVRPPLPAELAGAWLLEGISRLRPYPTLHTTDTVRSWSMNLPVEVGLLWKELGLEPRYPSVETGLPASLDACVSYRWLHPVEDRMRG